MKRLSRLARARPGQARPIAAPPQAVEREVLIDEIGARGDAVAEGADGRPIYAPYALPGERLRVRVLGERAEIQEILGPSPDRRAPPCAHFGVCGGCQLQHWEEGAYLAWKHDQVARALARKGFSITPEPIVPAWGAGRRRAAFHASREGGKLAFGFIERGAARLIPIAACPVLAPELAAAITSLRAVAALFVPARGEIVLHCLVTETGLDVSIKGAGGPARVAADAFEAAARAAEEADLARLSLDGEPLITRRAPLVRMGAARVAPAPGAFLQPTALGEDTLAALVLSALEGAERVVDLFCGVGTFALRLAVHMPVLALDSGAPMLAALKAGADSAAGALKPVSILRRDLLRTPLSAMEMKSFDAVVMDPPRSGARRQAEQIGASRARRVAFVSCDPASFARDARVLAEHGFSLTRATPVDQFRWSPHIEIVGAFER
jgi:23S rRNA (uracil1939-C5)-methyltransferase